MRNPALLAVLLVAATAANADVNRKYDRFKDRTEVMSDKGPWSSHMGTLNVSWGFRHQGEQMQTKPDGVDFMIGVMNKGWEYLRCHSVAFLADGKPVPVDKSKHTGSVQQGFVVEIITTTLATDAISQLVKAKKVEMQLCRTEYVFDDGDMKALREFEQALSVSRP